MPPQDTIPPTQPVQIPSIFKMVFWTVLAITILSLLIMAWIALRSEATEISKLPVLQKSLYDICSITWQMGFGAIIGLIGGKATEFAKPSGG